MPALERHDAVYVLDLGEGENRFHPDWLTEVESLLDEIEKNDEPRALVTKATGKFWSNGLDLEWLMEHPEQFTDYGVRVQALLSRVLTLPFVTVAALQGHTFAAGAMLSLAHDVRLMRADRGFWCLPEADINIPFTPGMSALIQSRLTPQAAHEAMILARRFGGTEAASRQIVDRALPESELLSAAIELAATHSTKAGPTLETIKARLHAPVIKALTSID